MPIEKQSKESLEALNALFYVYTLSDPRTGVPFYVGKGCGNRIDHHEAEARKGKHSRKCDQIREIETAGLKVVKSRIGFFADEQEAYDYETEVIDRIGLSNLTNVMRGGQTAWIDRVKLRAEKIAAANAREMAENRAKLAAWVRMASKWAKGCTVPNHRNGDAMGAEFFALAQKLAGVQC